MPLSARFFLCARCRCQVYICRQCDTGQVYCSGECSSQARRERQREANQRYSRSRRARVLSSERQRRHRSRHGAHKSIEVTDQTSTRAPTRSPSKPISLSASRARCLPALSRPAGEVICHFCTCICSKRVRLDFLSPGQRRHGPFDPLHDP